MAPHLILRLRYVQKLPDRDDPSFLAAYQAALTIDARKDPVSRVQPRSLEDLVRRYYASPAFVQLRETTQVNYRRLITRLLREHGEKPIKLLDPIGVRHIIHALAKTPAAANHTLRMLRALMRHAIEEGWRDDDPTRDVRRLKLKGKGPATWTEEEIAAFEVRWPIGSRPRLAFALLLYTGQRRSDIVRMGRQHVRCNVIEVRQVKTGTELLIPLHPALAELIHGARDRLTS